MVFNPQNFIRFFFLKLWYIIFNYPFHFLTALFSMFILYRVTAHSRGIKKEEEDNEYDNLIRKKRKQLQVQSTIASSSSPSYISSGSSSSNYYYNNTSTTTDDEEEKTKKQQSTIKSFFSFLFGNSNNDLNPSTSKKDINNASNNNVSNNTLTDRLDEEDVVFQENEENKFIDTNNPTLIRCPTRLLEDPNKLLGRTVLVIGGCCKGVGFEIAYALAQLGARKVVLACNNEKEAQEAIDNMTDISRGVVEYLNLDLSSFSSIKHFVNFYQNVLNYECHVLVNTILCEGMADTSKICNNSKLNTTIDGIEQNFQVNYLGRVYLIDLLLENLKRNHTRIVNVVELLKKPKKIMFSDLCEKTCKKVYNSDSDYFNFAMKCNVLWVHAFAKKLENEGITICCCDPELPSTYLPPTPSDCIHSPASTTSLLLPSTGFFAEETLTDSPHDVQLFPGDILGTNDYAEEITNFDKIQSLLYGVLCDKNEFKNGGYFTNFKSKKLPRSFKALKDIDYNFEQTYSLLSLITKNPKELHFPTKPSIVTAEKSSSNNNGVTKTTNDKLPVKEKMKQ
ncbi:hypothetical protein ABK040_000391 [Willaertia magna]